MEAYDPTSWTSDYVRRHKSECFYRLTYGVKQSIGAIRENDYHRAFVGLTAAFKGLVTMHESNCDDYSVELLILTWSIGNILAFKGIDIHGNEISDADRVAAATDFYELCLEVTDEGVVAEDIKKKLKLIGSMDKYALQRETEPAFPSRTLVELGELLRRMEAIDRRYAGSSASSSSSSSTSASSSSSSSASTSYSSSPSTSKRSGGKVVLIIALILAAVLALGYLGATYFDNNSPIPTGQTDPAAIDPATDSPNASAISAIVKTKGSVLKMRSGPSTDYDVITKIPDGTPVVILGENEDGSWAQIEYNGQTGWCSAKYLEIP